MIMRKIALSLLLILFGGDAIAAELDGGLDGLMARPFAVSFPCRAENLLWVC
jgi:hypothetical protein